MLVCVPVRCSAEELREKAPMCTVSHHYLKFNIFGMYSCSLRLFHCVVNFFVCDSSVLWKAGFINGLVVCEWAYWVACDGTAPCCAQVVSWGLRQCMNVIDNFL